MRINNIIKEDIYFIIESANFWESFKNKTILIAGANGFLPAYMVEVLLTLNEKFHQHNTQVIALVRNKTKAQNRFKHWLNCTNLRIVEHDICNDFFTERAIDFIIHAASQASPKYYGIDPVGTLKANTIGTANLLNLAKNKNVTSFLFFSSGEVYGEVPNEHIPTKETYFGYLSPTNVRSCYAESKRMGENMCVSWHHQFGVNAKIVRPFHTYGPGMDLKDGRVYTDFVANILARKNIEMHSAGEAKRAFCYLSDATIAFFTVLLKGVNAEAYNAGNPDEEHSILELAHTLVALNPALKLNIEFKINNTEPNVYLPSPIPRNSPDISKIKKLGWQPKIGIKEGFARVIESYIQ